MTAITTAAVAPTAPAAEAKPGFFANLCGTIVGAIMKVWNFITGAIGTVVNAVSTAVTAVAGAIPLNPDFKREAMKMAGRVVGGAIACALVGGFIGLVTVGPPGVIAGALTMAQWGAAGGACLPPVSVWMRDMALTMTKLGAAGGTASGIA